MTVQANIDARDILTRMYSGKPVALTAAQAEEAIFGRHYKGEGQPTIEDVLEAVESVRDAFGEREALVLLQRFGVERLKDLWIGSYAGLISFAEATIRHKEPPSGSWGNNNVPNHL